MRWVVGNWKMNLGPESACALARQLVKNDAPHGVHSWIAPSAESLAAICAICRGSKVIVGAQNACGEKPGAFTGELSIPTLKEIGGEFAIVGHSERRHVFGESDQLCAKRAQGILAQELKVIFCIGERLEERQSGKTEDTLKRQLASLLELIGERERKNLMIAYEPVWAIGTGVVAKEQEIAHAHKFIASLLGGQAPTPILYGGSVTPDNFGAILNVKDVSGGLVGGASLDAGKFSQLVKISGTSLA